MLLAACSGQGAPRAATGPVDVPVQAGAAGSELCGDLLASLPETLPAGARDLARRPVVGDPGRAAAWGDPAVTLGCGTAVPDPLDEQLQVGPEEGGLVTFSVHDLGTSTAFTTVGLPVTVEVVVPDAYDSTLLVPLTTGLLALGPPAS